MTNARMILYGDRLDVSRLPEKARDRIAGPAGIMPTIINQMTDQGVDVYATHDLNVIREVQAKRNPRPRLFEIGDPAHQPTANPRDTSIVVLKRGDEVIGCVGCRLKWLEGSLKEALEFGSLIMERPTGEQIMVCNAPIARSIDSVPVAVTTGLCVLEPDLQGGFKTLIRLLHLWVLMEWQWTYLVAMCTPEFARQYCLDVEGYEATGTGILWNRSDPETGLKTWSHYQLVHASRPWWRQLVADDRFADLSIPLGKPEEPKVPA